MGRPAKHPNPAPGTRHRVIVGLYEIIERQQRSLKPVAEAAGIAHSTLLNVRAGYKHYHALRLDTAEAVANVLGYRIVLERIPE